MKIKKLVMNELRANMYFVVWTFKEIQKMSTTLMWDDLSEWGYDVCKWVCITHLSNMMCCVITDNTKKAMYQSSLNHEIIHWVHYILDYKQFDTSYDHWTENLAYFIEYYIEQWTKFLHEINKKKPWQIKIKKKRKKSKDNRAKSTQE